MTPSGCPVTPGFPIRKSPDQSLLDSSPRHIAAYHVLHRLSTPRHPPCTLSSLTTFMRGCRAQRLRSSLRRRTATSQPCLKPLFQRSRARHNLRPPPPRNRLFSGLEAISGGDRRATHSFNTFGNPSDPRPRKNRNREPLERPASASSIVKEHPFSALAAKAQPLWGNREVYGRTYSTSSPFPVLLYHEFRARLATTRTRGKLRSGMDLRNTTTSRGGGIAPQAGSARFGAHLSVAGGLENAISSAVTTGCDCLQIFVKNQRQWRANKLSDEQVSRFRAASKGVPVAPLLAHASYLLNLASPNAEARERSILAMIDEVERCEALGVSALIFHPGAHLDDTLAAGIGRIARSLERGFSGKRGLQDDDPSGIHGRAR